MRNVEQFRSEFALEKPTHIAFNNAGLSLMTKKCAERMNGVTQHMLTEGCHHEPFWLELVEAKKTLAKFLDAELSEVAWVPNCSTGISLIANGYERMEDEEIIIFENEYPSNFYPWVDRSKKMGSKLNIIPAEKNLTRKIENVTEAITPKTRIVAFSYVQSDCGYLTDISAIAEVAHKVGAIVLIDVIQAMGVIPLSLKTSGADIICGGSHKWLCGPLGAGFMAVKNKYLEKISPTLHGALNYGTFSDPPRVDRKPFADARKFEHGTPLFHGIFGSAASMEVLSEYGVDNLRKRTLELRGILSNELTEMGFNIFGDPKSTGPQISCVHSKCALEKISEHLMEERITHALRPAPVEGEKVLRLSPHAYNTKDEISIVVRTLKKALA